MAMEEEEVMEKDVAARVADAQEESQVKSLIETKDSPELMMDVRPTFSEIKTTATPMNGLQHQHMITANPVIQIVVMMLQQQLMTQRMDVYCTHVYPAAIVATAANASILSPTDKDMTQKCMSLAHNGNGGPIDMGTITC